MTILETASSELAIIEERKAKVLESLEAIELLILNVKEPLAIELEALEQKAKELDSIQADELKRYKSLIAEKLWYLIEEHLTVSIADKRMIQFHEVSNHRYGLRFLYHSGYQEIYVEFAGKTIFKCYQHDVGHPNGIAELTLPYDGSIVAELLNLLNLD